MKRWASPIATVAAPRAQGRARDEDQDRQNAADHSDDRSEGAADQGEGAARVTADGQGQQEGRQWNTCGGGGEAPPHQHGLYDRNGSRHGGLLWAG